MVKKFSLVLLLMFLVVPPAIRGISIFPTLMNVNSVLPTAPHRVERELPDYRTVGDWWHEVQRLDFERCALQITAYQYDANTIATKTAFHNVHDHEVAKGWLSRLLALEISEQKAPDCLVGEHVLLELTFTDEAGHEIIFLALHLCDDSNRVFINGSFVSPEENIPGNIFLITDHDAMELFNELRLLAQD